MKGGAGDEHLYCIGLSWKRSAVRTGADQARKVAASAGSTHLLLHSGGTRDSLRAYGHGDLGKKVSAEVLSLASAFVHSTQQPVALLLLKVAGKVWVCAIADGTIVNGTDVVLTEPEALEKAAKFKVRYTDGTVALFGDVLEDSRSIDLEFLQRYARDHLPACRLEKVARRTSIPKPLLYGAIALTGVLVVKAGVDQYTKYQQRLQAEREAAGRDPELSPAQAWSEAVKGWNKDTRVLRPAGLSRLLDDVGRFGLDVNGWALSQVDCERTKAAPGVWACSLGYKRDVKGRATSRDLLRALSQGCTARWKSVDEATVECSFKADLTGVDVATLGKSDAVLLEAMSRLQRYSQAFETTTAPVFAAIDLGRYMPKKADGTPYLVDPSNASPRIEAGRLSVTGPLRSASVLIEPGVDGAPPLPVSYDKLALKIKQDEAVGVNKSRLQLEKLEGEMYGVR